MSNEILTELVEQYIRDFKVWNDFACEASLKDPNWHANDSQVQRAYKDLIAKFCPPGKRHQPIAFSSTSDPDPEKEKIQTISRSNAKAIIRTTCTNANSFSANYEYELENISGRWFLIEVYYLNDEGRHKGL